MSDSAPIDPSTLVGQTTTDARTAFALLGVSRSCGYAMVRRGRIKVVHTSDKNFRVLVKPLLAMLELMDEDAPFDVVNR